jgi:halocyanin-like protein
MERRRFLAVVGAAAFAGCTGGGDSGGGDEEYGDWFDGVTNYDGEEADLTGESEPTVLVGAGEDDLKFDPPAIRVSAGTTVVWEWTGRGGRHNVFEQDEAFESEYYSEEGATFEFTFEETGLYKYYCVPHDDLGMKGGVRVIE